MYNNWDYSEKVDGDIKYCVCPKCKKDIVATYNIKGIKPKYFDFPIYCPKCGNKNSDDKMTNGQVFQLIFGFDPLSRDMAFSDTFFSEEYSNSVLYKDLMEYYDINGRFK